ncbi:abortive infection protein [Enterobacter hormaechei]|uniref:AAA family ATPase n=1 Tax=Enterobacter hormaechei TaxID=158836 RepID=UPI000735CC9A|nr:ATP-binding protein [Enterobacter hormaechei]DAL18383.1 MAG TPA_asm: AAA domain protein [Caudoviricetes sp.]HCR1862104.1 ATP-binding protein [Enterobacter hormaechei subsp. steigerwaltii]ASQ76799.1 abortive infection protein [Enterobacter hormaechei]EKU3234588.1 ATP-binding protein [Enterobacter hormaechei]ELC6280460.1 ATP-binding protein [Enterobacter hormaechei]
MIKWYRFKNFYSFKEDTFVDLTLKENSSFSSYDTEVNGTKIAKIMTVMGSNGSGKSNMLKPLAFLRWFCSHSFQKLESKSLLPFYPHYSCVAEPSEIEICFIDSDDKNQHWEYKYFVKLTRDRVHHEELKLKTSRQYTTLFKRVFDTDKDKYICKSHKLMSDENAFPVSEMKSIPANSSTIAYMHRKDSIIASLILDNLSSIDNNLNVYGKINFNYSNVMNATEFYSTEKDIFNQAIKYLKRMDLGLDNIILKEQEVLEKETGERRKEFMPYGVHKCDGKKFRVPFYMESSGTQACYYFILTLIIAIRDGGVAVIDELDSDLHPNMVVELLSMFENEAINTKNAQLIFSCHSPEVLKSLKKHHVYLVEKDDGKSECWRLDDVKGLRSQDNLYSKYITGALGGVPDICL